MTRVVFVPDDFWRNPPERNTMTDKRARIRRPLDDDERTLLTQLAIWALAEQTGVSDDEAQRALDRLNNDSGLDIRGDDYDVYIRTREHGHTIVHATREWLEWHAHSGEQLTSDELRRVLRRGKGERG